MFWKKKPKKKKPKGNEEKIEIRAYSKEGGFIKSLESQGGITTSAAYGGMGIRELQLRMELLIEPVLSTHNSVFDAAKQLASFAKVDQDRFLSSVDNICDSNIELAFNFCQLAPRSLQIVDEENWENWIAFLIEDYKANGMDAAIATMKNVDDYVTSLEHAPSSVSLDEVSRVIESFVIGLSGRYLGIEINDEHYTDTESIRLPEVSEQFNNREDNFTIYKAMAVHQWAQTWFGTYRMNVETLVKSFDNPERALSIFHKLETIRLDARIENELPGIARAMNALDKKLNQKKSENQDYSKTWLRAVKKLTEPGMTVRDSMFFLEAVYKDDNFPEDKFYQGTLKPELARAVINNRKKKEKENLSNKLSKLQQELEANTSTADIRNSEVTNDAIAIGEEGRTGFSIEEVEDESMPDGFKVELQFDNNALTPPEDLEELLESILQDFGEIPDDYLNTDEPDKKIKNESESENIDIENLEDDFLYDEWDHSRQKYRKNWCHLKELTIKPAMFM